ncbi:TIM barrel protein [Polystyrenella longa]|uniref:TIM barrel protein n=1 Tax=Polystyrenella longa TaxID=2528007 RepID=UPI0018D247C5|nr:TIM barrel protein [Polystyrenella longa]
MFKLDLFNRDNLVAWCVVPFDSERRGPEARAAMLAELGIQRLAYDYRAEHVPTFEDEIKALQSRKIELTAWWFPGVLNEEAKMTLEIFRKHEVHPQLWITGGGAPTNSAAEQRQRVQTEAERLRPIAEAAAEAGCQVALYNHGGWFGEPENQIEIIEELNLDNVGIVYNLHHGHAHVDRFESLLQKMKPYLLTLNLNGMVPGGDQQGQKIVPLGAGELDLQLLTTIAQSGWQGPVGILDHDTSVDTRLRLQDNLEGLDWLMNQLKGNPAGVPPKYRSWKKPATKTTSTAPPANAGHVLKGNVAYRTLPLTIACQAQLAPSNGYQILLANEEKRSGTHWELFTQPESGKLSVYLPGYAPDHVHSETMICDSKSHEIAMQFEPNRVRLYIDGKQVVDQPVKSMNQAPVPGGFGIGRLVEGRVFTNGEIQQVQIIKGTSDKAPAPADALPDDENLLLVWNSISGTVKSPASPEAAKPVELLYDPAVVSEYIASARKEGDAARGLEVFTSAKSACISCHKLGEHGGTIGPDLTKIGVDRKPNEIVESIFWPKRDVKPEYVSHSIITDEGKILSGYLTTKTEDEFVLKNPASDETTTISTDEIDEHIPGSTLMPEGLTSAMSRQQQLDLIQFVSTLGTDQAASLDAVELLMARLHVHGPASFEYDRGPLSPEDWPNWEEHMNRDRLYDFYAKEAEHFRQQETVPHLIPGHPGLDGGEFGHWGNQTEETWADDRWNETELGSVQAGIFHHGDLTISRAICVRLGEHGELSACFNPETLSYPVIWKDGFVKFSSVRHGFMHGLILDGTVLAKEPSQPPTKSFKYLGFFRHGRHVVFHYRLGDVEMYDIPHVVNGIFTRTQVVAGGINKSNWASLIEPGKPQWPQILETEIKLGDGEPYAVDNIELPYKNPWKALLFCGGHAFLPDGRALVCTMQGDVWLADGFMNGGTTAKWKRFASGLHHALGLVVHDGAMYVQGRDQITRLYDHNHDGEADQYECFSSAYTTSNAGHDFICGLQRDSAGNFYTASGNQGLLRISPDGEQVEVLATGFRNPDGLGLTPEGLLTVPCSEGEWTPASMICAVNSKQTATESAPNPVPFFGYRKQANADQPLEVPPALPLVYLPRGLDNSSGGQTYIDSQKWGPLEGEMIHFSYGTGSHFLLLRDEVNGQLQGGIVPLPGEFLSGAHRGRFHPLDGQLYVTGMTGWGCYALQDGCFQRVRYTNKPVNLPKRFHVFENGILIEFTSEIDREIAENTKSHLAQCWNYRYSQAYGSPEYSPSHFGTKGHDVLEIASAHVLAEEKLLFLEIPELQPVNQLQLRMHVNEQTQEPADGLDLFLTVHQLDEPFTKFSGYEPRKKTIAAHPILFDLTLSTKKITNPWEQPVPNARQIVLRTGKNLSYETRSLSAKAGEMLELKLVNPDVVPHNWALVEPGALKEVGEMANRLIADPEAVIRQYIPESERVLVYTDVVSPQEEMSIFFRAPETPGNYPFLCTFPGHWMVMNGMLTVE